MNDDIPSNVVAGGVPAKELMSIEEYYTQRKREYVAEATEYAKSIKDRFERKPKEQDFVEFFPLFLERKRENIRPEFRQRLTDGGMLSDSRIDEFLQTEPEFESFEEFLEQCNL